MGDSGESHITTELGFTVLSVIAIMVTAGILLWNTAADNADLSSPQVLTPLVEESIKEISESEIEVEEDTEVAVEVVEIVEESVFEPKTEEVLEATVEEEPADEELIVVEEIAGNEELQISDKQEEQVSSKKVTVEVIVPTAGYSSEVSVVKGATVLQVMNASGVSITTKNFSGLGKYVKGINGIEEDTSAGMYWIFYINGEKAKAGISTVTVSKGDTITWQYEREQ